MFEEISPASLLLLAASVAAFILMIRHAHRLKKHADRKSEELHKRVSSVEKHQHNLHKEIQNTRKSVDEKIDRDYLEKRMEGLVTLVRKR
ncbi:MAG TPA: hypothetical protein VGQ00_00440 [Candidatus Norongarragalinales archaeon]|jgi:uncharacterized protein YlxW (UPF0749 family)|nr:hypothetical protein [Candidatus Norongarragalinales archaeon]